MLGDHPIHPVLAKDLATAREFYHDRSGSRS
jgi:hypothetical protein